MNPITLWSASEGSVVLSQAAGVFSLACTGNLSFGGGELAGFFKCPISISPQLSAKQLGDAGLVLLAAAVPSLGTEIAALKVLYDAEISKV